MLASLSVLFWINPGWAFLEPPLLKFKLLVIYLPLQMGLIFF